MFNENLRHARLRRGWSQSRLGERLSVSQQTVASWETGRSSPDPGSIAKLSRLLTVSADWLLNGVDAEGAPDTDEAYTGYEWLHANVPSAGALSAESLTPEDKEILDNISFAYYGEVKKITKQDEKDLIALVKMARRLREMRDEDGTKEGEGSAD